MDYLLTSYLGFLFVTVSLACNDYLISGPDGTGTDGVSNDQISASTFLTAGTEPWKARLNVTVGPNILHYGSWMPSDSDSNPYIQADLGMLCRIHAISTLGRFGLDNWVEEYTVSYSVNGSSWVTLNDTDGPILFPGNTNASEVEVQNSVLFDARYIQLHPTNWKHSIALRFDLIGCCDSIDDPVTAPADCSSSLVTKSYGVRNSQITASSYYSSLTGVDGYEPWAGRLEGKSASCNTFWVTFTGTAEAYVQVDFRRETIVHCIVTKGEAQFFVASYNVQYSMNGSTWQTVLDVFGNVKLFAGNDGIGDSETIRCLPEPMITRYIRIAPISLNRALLIKFDFIGCNATGDVKPVTEEFYEGQYCMNYLSSGDEPVWDESFKASSFFTIFHTEPWMARYTSNFGWAPTSNTADQYIQVDLDFKHIVRAIVISGCGQFLHVRTFYVQYGDDGVSFDWIRDNGSNHPKLFPGNDGEEYVDDYVMFPEAVYTRYIRVYPLTYCTHKCMRFDVIGCSNDTNVYRENVTCSYNGTQCDTHLLTDLELPDDSFSASSTAGSLLEPWNARYNSSHGWCPRGDHHPKYIQVDLQTEYIITCILTRTSEDNGSTRSYYIQYYNDSHWVEIDQLIPGNYNDDLPMKRSLPVPVNARFLRLYPYTGTACLRFDILGCLNDSTALQPKTSSICRYDGNICHTYLLQYVSDANITASSAMDGFGPEMGRLSSGSSWTSNGTLDQYIQVDFETQMNITCITTQGSGLAMDHVRSFYLDYSADGANWTSYLDIHGQIQLFPANDDSNYKDEVTRHLHTPLYTKSVRISPLTYTRNISLRFDIIGCPLPNLTLTTEQNTTVTTPPTSTTTISSPSTEPTSTTEQNSTVTTPPTSTTTISSPSTEPTSTTEQNTTVTTPPTSTTTISSPSTEPTSTTEQDSTVTTPPTSTTTISSPSTEPTSTTEQVSTVTTPSTSTTVMSSLSTDPTSTTEQVSTVTTPSTSTTAMSSSSTEPTSTTEQDTTVTTPSSSTTAMSSPSTEPTSTTEQVSTVTTPQTSTTAMSSSSTEPTSTTEQVSTTTNPPMATSTLSSSSTESTTTELATTVTTPSTSTLTISSSSTGLTTPSITTTPPSTSSQYYVIPNNVASCLCKCTLINNTTLEIGSLQLAEKLEQLISATKIAKDQTKSALMKKISAPDDRPSASTMGGLGASLLSVTVGIFVVFDVSKFLCTICSK